MSDWRLGLASAGVLCLSTLAPAQETNPFAGDPAAAAEGARLYKKAGCYSCHGHEAEGAVGPDLTDDQWVYRPTDATLFKAIDRGRPGTNMVGWGKELSAEEIWQIVAFIRSRYVGDPAKIIW